MLLMIDVGSFLKSALDFILVLSVLVIVHEWGHFIVAKLCRMRVEDFSLFFGKRLIRLGTYHGTEYNVRSIPLGGFVKIAGMEPDDISNGAPLFKRRDSDKAAQHRSTDKFLRGLSEEALAEIDSDQLSERVRQAVEHAVDAEGKLTPDGKAELNSLLASTAINPDEHRYIEAVLAAGAYEPDPYAYNQKPLWQRAAVIFAGPFMSIFFGYALFCTLGFTTGLPEPDRIDNVVVSIVANSRADKAGMKAGDRIVQIDSQPIHDGNTMVDIIHNSVDKPLHLRILRGNQALGITATPYGSPDTVFENGKQVTKIEGHLGFQIRPAMIRYTPVESVKRGTKIIFTSIGMMLERLFSRHVKDDVGGPIAIAGQIHEARQEGPVYVLLMAASLSISLGIINLFPIPILDGGHLLLLGIEGLRRRKLSSREIHAAQMVGLSIIGVLFVLVMFNDIWRLTTSK